MSVYKFSCPSCGQHFAGDFGYSGVQLTCPACQNSFIVPNPGTSAPLASASAPRAQRTTVALPARLPPKPPPTGVPPQSAKTSGLAIASLICSIGNFLIIPLGFIPGIICGHLAMKQLAREPVLKGRGLAKAGLIIGYVGLVLFVVVVVAVLILGFSFTKLHAK
jgi:Domain of unknown function (DUF4190)